jgi:hypothetical protein
MGPIKGNVYGKRNGRNFLIRAPSGLGSTAMMVVGSNVNGAYSESDMIKWAWWRQCALRRSAIRERP